MSTTITHDAASAAASTDPAPVGATYEYRTVRCERDLEPLVRDTYEALGWIVEDHGPLLPNPAQISLKLKRDRHTKNRQLLLPLQRKAESALESITHLNRTQGRKAAVVAAALGVIGAALLAGSVFTMAGGIGIVSIVLGVAGLLVWLVGYLAHGRVRARTVASLAQLVESHYEAVYQASEEAARLRA